MSILSLADNGMFLQSMRHRLRPVMVASAGVLTAAILGIIFSSVGFSAQDYPSPNFKIFHYILVGHLFLMLGFATYAVYTAAAREKMAGTLDFHRASPTPALSQAIGLMLGAASLEWVIFLVTLPVNLVMAAQSTLGIGPAIEGYAGIIVFTFLLHLAAMLLGLVLTPGQQHKRPYLSWLVIFIIFNVLFSNMFAAARWSHSQQKGISLSSHITCFPGLGEISKADQMNSNKSYIKNNSRFAAQEVPPSYAFGTKVHPLLLQIMLQVPLMIVLLIGIMRLISLPHAPALSKPQMLFGAAYAMLVCLGDYYTLMATWDVSKVIKFTYATGSGLYTFKIQILALAILGMIVCTPSRLAYLTGLRKSRRQGKPMGPLDDHNSNFLWLMTFTVISLGFTALYKSFIDPHILNNEISGIVLILLQMIALAGAWESYRLSKFGSKPLLFVVGLSLIWIFIPLFVGILNNAFKQGSLLYGLALSPFVTMTPGTHLEKQGMDRAIVFGINAAAAIGAIVSSAWQRHQLTKALEAESKTAST